MTRLPQTLAALTVLLSPVFCPADEVDLESSPLLKAEYCFEHAPDEVIDHLGRAGWFACEACTDQALALYAERVKPLVDERCPGASEVRGELHRAIEAFDRAFARVTDGNWFGHETARHAAYVEWILIRTWEESRRAGKRKGYSHADLTAVTQLWYRARSGSDDDEQRVTLPEFSKMVERAMAALQGAERRCTPAQVVSLRDQVMHRLARWL